MEWWRANGGPLALVVVGLGILGFTNRWAGIGLIAVGLCVFGGQQIKRLTRPASQTAIDDSVELASPEHREALRTVLHGISRHIEAGRPVALHSNWAGAVEAHYPRLAVTLDSWNKVASRRIDAPGLLSQRFACELEHLDLSEEFNRRTIAEGFAALTAHRAIVGQLGIRLTRSQLWDAYKVTTHGPPDGIHLKASHEIAVTMPKVDPTTSDEAYNAMADERIDKIEPTFWAAQSWPESREVAEAEQALAAFNRQAVFDEIDKLNAPERIRTAAGCPICGAIG